MNEFSISGAGPSVAEVFAVVFLWWFGVAGVLTVAFFVSLARCCPVIVDSEGGEVNEGTKLQAPVVGAVGHGASRRMLGRSFFSRRNIRRGQLGRWLVISRAVF